MTILKKPVTRKTNAKLNGEFGPDREKAIVIRMIPGTDTVPDTLELRPERTRRVERVALLDVYRFALRCRVGRELLEKARERKAKKAERLASQRQQRAEAKLRHMPNE